MLYCGYGEISYCHLLSVRRLFRFWIWSRPRGRGCGVDIPVSVGNVVRSGELSEVELDGRWGEGQRWGECGYWL